MSKMTNEKYIEWCLDRGLAHPEICKDCGNAFHYVCAICQPTFFQPERSKREDLPGWASRAIMMPDGLCHFEDGTIVDSKQPVEKDAVL